METYISFLFLKEFPKCCVKKNKDKTAVVVQTCNPITRELRQENLDEFKASLGYIAFPDLKNGTGDIVQ